MSQWKQELFGCFNNSGNCLFAACCPCIAFGQVAEKIGESCCGCGCAVLIGQPCALCNIRGKIRESHGIEGGTGEDFCLSCIMPLCVLTQMMAEVNSRGMAKDGSVVTMQPTSNMKTASDNFKAQGEIERI